MLDYKIEEFRHACHDLHGEYVQYGHDDQFYIGLAELLDLVIDVCREATTAAVPDIKDELTRLLEVIYRLDISRIDNWNHFVWTMKTMRGGNRIIETLTDRDYRRPPKPKWYYLAQRGYCRLCGAAILRGSRLDRRRNWHEKCLERFRQIYWPRTTRELIWSRDGGLCRLCGAFDESWQMDHVRPLIESNGDIAFWLPENIQTLCRRHHIEKTSKENSARSKPL